MCCNGILALLALIIGFMAIVYLLYQVYSYIRCGCGRYGPFVSSYGKIKEDILEEARKVLRKADRPLKVTDLGCGSGALLLPLAKEFPEHQFTGYEWDVVPLTMGKIKAAGLKNITFVKGDYMKQSYADMDLILCYVLKVTGEPLGKKLAQEIKKDCIVISEMFPLGHLHEIKQIESSIYGVPEKIYVYQKPHSQKDSVQPRKSAPHNGKAKSQSEKSAPRARKAKSQAGKETPGAGKSKSPDSKPKSKEKKNVSKNLFYDFYCRRYHNFGVLCYKIFSGNRGSIFCFCRNAESVSGSLCRCCFPAAGKTALLLAADTGLCCSCRSSDTVFCRWRSPRCSGIAV